jgi:NADH-quinone oxidoreductase subunit J
MTIAFYSLATLALIGGVLAVRLRNLIHAVLSLILFFLALAGLFILLCAEFIAAVQILVYVGAIGILILFAVMLTPNVTGIADRVYSRGSWWGLLIAGGVLAFLLQSIRDTKIESTVPRGILHTGELGKVLMTNYVLGLEIIALLLTAALIGAVVIAQGDPKKDLENQK